MKFGKFPICPSSMRNGLRGNSNLFADTFNVKAQSLTLSGHRVFHHPFVYIFSPQKKDLRSRQSRSSRFNDGRKKVRWISQVGECPFNLMSYRTRLWVQRKCQFFKYQGTKFLIINKIHCLSIDDHFVWTFFHAYHIQSVHLKCRVVAQVNALNLKISLSKEKLISRSKFQTTYVLNRKRIVIVQFLLISVQTITRIPVELTLSISSGVIQDCYQVDIARFSQLDCCIRILGWDYWSSSVVNIRKIKRNLLVQKLSRAFNPSVVGNVAPLSSWKVNFHLQRQHFSKLLSKVLGHTFSNSGAKAGAIRSEGPHMNWVSTLAAIESVGNSNSIGRITVPPLTWTL